MKKYLSESPKKNKLFAGVAHAEKYQSGSLIGQKLVDNFMDSILRMVQNTNTREVHEIGCGEGHILGMLASKNFKVKGCDISIDSLKVAKSEAEKHSLDINLKLKNIYELNRKDDSSDTVLCCEVLEHLTEPEKALLKLISITKKDLILSVPNEPIWHILNMLRGKYLSALGNTPGHYQHWSKNQFIKFVSKYAEIIEVKTPLPWTLIHCRPKKNIK